jgi:hypothetical protein
MDFTESERNLVLAGLVELRITRLEDDRRCADLDALAVKLGGMGTLREPKR